MRMGRYAASSADFEEVVELTRETRAGELFRAFHALAKARIGDLSALGLIRDEIRETLKIGAGFQSESPYVYYMIYYDAACIHAALAGLALQDQGGSRAERQRFADRDLESAVELLDKARATGEFEGAVKCDEIRRERLLDPLHSHPRFQLLMMDLTFPSDPFDARPAPQTEAGNRTSHKSQPRENSGSSPAPITPSRGG